MDNSSVEKNIPAPGISPKTQFGNYQTHSGYLPMSDQLAATVAREFEALGFSVVRLTAPHDAPTLSILCGATRLVVIINERDGMETDDQREWAGEQSDPVIWCSGRSHARQIAKALQTAA